MPPKLLSSNHLFYGDNLDILREYIVSETVDLVYLDPPFNSNRNYNVLFKDESGQEAESQILAFEDTWHWSEIAYNELLKVAPSRLATVITALVSALGRNQLTAYLVMMAARLRELHRVLKPTGSLYLHCDPTASHYLKIILDIIFGPQNFRNEIVWKRSDAHNDGKQGARQYGRIHDVLLFYTKSNNWVWNTIYTPLPDSTKDGWYKNVEEGTGRLYNKADLTAAKPGGDTLYEWKGVRPPTGRYWAYSRAKMEQMERDGRLVYSASGRPYMKRYLDESSGVSLQDWWNDIEMLRGIKGTERLGYPTQKPLALLERIIEASSNPGDTILDPFCGCGTAIAAAQKLNRKWIGIDVTRLAVTLQKFRLKTAFNLEPKKDYTVIGEPTVLSEARELATLDEGGRYQFQWWALGLVEARPLGGAEGSKEGKKGSDRGIDGEITFIDDNSGKQKRIIVQVKSGKVSSRDIRDLVGTIGREQATIGVFITLEEPTSEMKIEAGAAGFYTSPGWNKDYPRLQILTIDKLLHGAKVEMPAQTAQTFKKAQQAGQSQGVQAALFGTEDTEEEAE